MASEDRDNSESKRELARILIVDDDPGGRETLEALLFAQGYDLIFAENGADALSQVAQNAPDLVLLDVMMPGMDGFEVCRRLRADPEHAEIPVILVTALDDRDSRLRGLEDGADDFITKPFDRAELRARVRTIVRLNRYRCLLAERARFEWVVERSREGYLIVSGSDEVLYANPQARLYLDLPRDSTETITGSFLELADRYYHREPREMWSAWPEAPVREESAKRYLVRPESESAETFWLQVDAGELSPGMFLLHLRDVTADMLARRQTWSFQAQISHKFRTPLSAVLGFLAILKDDDALSDIDRQTYISLAFQGATRLNEGVRDVLRYAEACARPGRGQCRLSEISGFAGKIRSGLELEPVQIFYEQIEAPEDIYVSLSPTVLEQILWELLENAKKFHPRNTPTLEVHCSLGEEGVSIRVYDDGLTLSPAQLTRMWHPYYQSEKYFTGETSGMGLGLPAVESLIWGAGGGCRAYNRKEGPGVVVELLLPRQELKKANDTSRAS